MAYETDNKLPENEQPGTWRHSRALAAAVKRQQFRRWLAGGVGSDGGGSVRVPRIFCEICD